MRNLGSASTFITLCWLIAPHDADAQGIITTIAGTDTVFSGNGRPALSVGLGQISSITVDPDGNPIFSDAVNCVFVRIKSDGFLEVLAGNGICAPNLVTSGEGGAATSTTIHNPRGAVFDPQGTFYYASLFQVRKVTSGVVTTVGGGFPTGFSGDGGPAVRALMNNSSSPALDGAGNLYIADASNRVRMITPDGTISTVAGNGTGGFSGDGGPATSASLSSPRAVAVDSAGSLYIADTFNRRIRKVTRGTISTLVSDLRVNSLSVDGAGNIYAAAANAVYRIAAGSSIPVRIAGSPTGVAGFAGDNGSGLDALFDGFNSEIRVAADKSGAVYVADENNCRVRKIAPDGTITTVAGNGRFGSSGENIPAVSSVFDFILGFALDANGNKYVSEHDGNRVRRIGSDGRMTTVAGTGDAGSAGDGGPAIEAQLRGPRGLLSAGGFLYIADSLNNRIRRVNAAGVITTFATLNSPNTLAMDAAGNLYVATLSQILRIDARGVARVIAGTGELGYSGDRGPAVNAALNQPRGLAFDSTGNLYIADLLNNRVRQVTPGGIISTFAGDGGRFVTGDGGQAEQAQVGQPSALAFDSAGNLYIGQSERNVVRKVTPAGIISTFAGGGFELNDGGPATSAQIGSVTDLAVDPAGNVFVVGPDRVRQILAAPPAMTVSATRVEFPAVPSGGAPLTGSVVISGAVPGLAFTTSARTNSGGDWLSIDATQGKTPRLITISADPGSLAPGSYTGTVTVTPAAATPATLTVTVVMTVGPALSPRLSLDRDETSFTLSTNSSAGSVPVVISNSGGQTLNYVASAATRSGGNWLFVSPVSGSATPARSSTLTISANPAGLNPGTYIGTVTVAAGAAGTRAMTVTLTVSQNPQAVLLTQTGLSFRAVAEGGVLPPQSFGVINAGTGVMNWTASASTTTPGANWLRISSAAGSTDATGVVPQVTVNVSIAGLAPGRHYGTVRIDAPGTANLVRVVTVFLEVLPAGSPISAAVFPAELTFHAPAGGGVPSSQTVSLYNVGASPRSSTSSISGELFVSGPRDALLNPNVPATVVVQPFLPILRDSTSIMTFQFSDGTVQSVKLRLVAPRNGAAAATTERHFAEPPAADSACPPREIVLTVRSLNQSFNATAGWPVGLTVTATDDCQNPLVASSGRVWAQFDNGEDDIPLEPLGDGTWQGTWRPKQQRSNATVTIKASAGSLPPTAKVIHGALGPQSDRPTFTRSSVTSLFAPPEPSREPIAPGSFLSIYGERLGDFNVISAAPFSPQLGNTKVFVGDQAAPVQYVSENQLNIVVPNNVRLTTNVQIRVQRGLTLSEPVGVNTAPGQPSLLHIGGSAYAVAMPASGDQPFVVAQGAETGEGDVLTIFAVGLGATTPIVAEGTVSPGAPFARVPNVSATIGGRPADVPFAGLAPGFVGLYQLNVVVPGMVTPGSAVPLVITAGQQDSFPVTLHVR